MVIWVDLKVDGNLHTEDPIESDLYQPWLLVIVELMTRTHSMLKKDPIKESCRTSA